MSFGSCRSIRRNERRKDVDSFVLELICPLGSVALIWSLVSLTWVVVRISSFYTLNSFQVPILLDWFRWNSCKTEKQSIPWWSFSTTADHRKRSIPMLERTTRASHRECWFTLLYRIKSVLFPRIRSVFQMVSKSTLGTIPEVPKIRR